MEQIEELRLVYEAMLDKKAENCLILEMKEQSFCDYFVICTATSQVQTKAISDQVDNLMRKKAHRKKSMIEGYQAGNWIVLDYYDLVVHIFTEDTREHFQLEELSANVPRFKL